MSQTPALLLARAALTIVRMKRSPTFLAIVLTVVLSVRPAHAFIEEVGAINFGGQFTVKQNHNFNVTDVFGTFGPMLTLTPGSGIFSGVTVGTQLTMNIPELWIYRGNPAVPLPAMEWTFAGFTLVTKLDTVAGGSFGRTAFGQATLDGNGHHFEPMSSVPGPTWQFDAPFATGPIVMSLRVFRENGLPARVPETGGTLALLALAVVALTVIGRTKSGARLRALASLGA